MEHDIPLDLVINLDQTSLSHVTQSKYTPSSKESKNVSMKGLDDKRQITTIFVVSASGSFLPIHLLYEGKSKRCLPKFRFPSEFNVTIKAGHWSNIEKCEELLQFIIFPYFYTKKKELCSPEEERALIIMDASFKCQDNDK